MTPAADELCVFAVKSGEIGKRFDVRYSLNNVISVIDTKYSVVKFGTLITHIYRYPTFYGIEYISNGVPVIKGTNISREGDWIKLDELDYITDKTNEKFPRTILKSEDLIMSVRGEVGKVSLVNSNLQGGNINANVIKISLNNSVSATYIWRYLNSTIGKLQIRKQLSGGVQETITVPAINDIAVVLPEYEAQLRLSELLDFATQQRDKKLREANELLSGIDCFVLEQMGIGKIDFKPRTAIAVTLGQLKADRTFGVAYYNPERLAVIHALENDPIVSTYKLDDAIHFVRKTVQANCGEPYLGLASVENNTGELSGVEEKAEGLAFEYQKGDVLYARLRPYLNKVLCAETSGICSTEFHVMRIMNNSILPEYLVAIMRSKIIVSQTKHMMTGNTHPRISNDDVRNLRIPIPSMGIQQTIVDEIHGRLELSRKRKQEAETEWAKAKERFEKELLGG
jgi:restriction endonuclease S subunit